MFLSKASTSIKTRFLLPNLNDSSSSSGPHISIRLSLRSVILPASVIKRGSVLLSHLWCQVFLRFCVDSIAR
ncbi:hypothetical protein AAFF_G00322940 [Aldrovandia affinis]|uniref:Uncharacterized protein n=1 Tax=Aldrovandia affinis TaxID=143900 RepID=A0AAD7SN68_9TELE|nr:hypothetical protein AAFF_G00322940 [Aldrovandia affinis]